ncbi:uncharacterized protein FIBRA_08173 [Fibroporia radiculosa]|uniref:HTH CENPB-type domain-containing protein n=1 Tax=Fibroporia radiculosa TaxID=599839 RepID=J4H512_9APHY|nr:uncharacterized protein FIBRA_08173 [Fibroporia radiculosa]CCM05934.1 predicted protein [Fibroporia radiculosa]
MAWNAAQSSPPNSAASTSSSLYSAMSQPDDRVDYARTTMHSRQVSNPYAGHPHSPSLHSSTPDPALSFDSPQIQSSIGPSRILTRRRARAATHIAESAQSTPGQPYDVSPSPFPLRSSPDLFVSFFKRRQHSLAFAGPSLSRPQTPSGDLPALPLGVNAGPVGSISVPSAPYHFMPSHSRSTSGSASSSNARSASPALSVASTRTSLSSSTSAHLSHPYPSYPESDAQVESTRPKHKKKRLLSIHRKEICEFALAHDSMKQEEIASHFGVERSTVSKILKEKHRWLHVRDDEKVAVAKFRPSKFPEIEHQLEKWLQQCTKDDVHITDAMIREEAKQVARNLGWSEDRFKASSGWVENYKIRVGIKGGKCSVVGRDALRARANGCGFLPPDVAQHTPDDPLQRELDALPASLPDPPPAPAQDRALEPESGHEDRRTIQTSSAMQVGWPNAASSSGVYDHPVAHEPLSLPCPVPLAMPQPDGEQPGQTYLVSPIVHIHEPEFVPSLTDAEALVDKLLFFFADEANADMITIEQEETLREIKVVLYDQIQGSVRR